MQAHRHGVSSGGGEMAMAVTGSPAPMIPIMSSLPSRTWKSVPTPHAVARQPRYISCNKETQAGMSCWLTASRDEVRSPSTSWMKCGNHLGHTSGTLNENALHTPATGAKEKAAMGASSSLRKITCFKGNLKKRYAVNPLPMARDLRLDTDLSIRYYF